jgi:hypothetical protein
MAKKRFCEVGIYTPGDKQVRFKKIEMSLETYYKIIGCDIIDITTILGNKHINVIVDDEGLLVNKPFGLLFIDKTDKKTFHGLAGVLIFTGIADKNGELTSLTKEDKDFLSAIHIAPYIVIKDNPKDFQFFAMVIEANAKEYGYR